jgi:hypothetical protein
VEQQPATALFVAEDDEVRTRPQVCPGVFTAEADAVEKGALSITNVSYNAQTANQSTQQFNVIVPSENVFIDRAVDWISGGVLSIPVTLASTVGTATGTGTFVLMTMGEVALAAFPSHQCVAQMTATINDATVTVNTQDGLNYGLRRPDIGQNR